MVSILDQKGEMILGVSRPNLLCIISSHPVQGCYDALMEYSGALAPTAAIAARVREIRKRRGMTAAQLADVLSELGVSWHQSTVTKLEKGTRENVSVVEWLALAAALSVAPVHLLVPLEDGVPYRVTPAGEAEQPSERVRAWVRGQRPLPGTDFRDFFSEVPESEFTFAQPGPIPPDVTTEEGED